MRKLLILFLVIGAASYGSQRMGDADAIKMPLSEVDNLSHVYTATNEWAMDFSTTRSLYNWCFEDFESWPPPGWTLIPASGTGSWQQSPLYTDFRLSPQTGADGTAHGAEYSSWDYSPGTNGALISPDIDLVGTTAPILSYYFWNHTPVPPYGNTDSIIISISTNAGVNWTFFATLKGTFDNWSSSSLPLSAYIGDTIRVRFTGVSDYGGSNIAIDEVKIGQPPNHDVQINSCNIDEYTEPDIAIMPTALVKNLTENTETFQVFCLVDSVGDGNEVQVYIDSQYVSNLAALDTQTVAFANWTNHGGNIYNFTFYTLLAGDEYPPNDTLRTMTYTYFTSRKVLGELITNTGCSPCKPANDTLDAIYASNPEELVFIRYHGWWPSSGDPFYQANIPENQARIYYYGADYAPHFHINGSVDGGSSRNEWRSMLQDQHDNTRAPLTITLTGDYDTLTQDWTIIAELFGTGKITDTNLKLRYAITEDSIHYNAPNGQTIFHQVFRDMFPNTSGVPITIDHGQTVVDTQDFTVNPSWVGRNCYVAVFLQNDDNHKVLQSNKIALTAFPGIQEGQTTTDLKTYHLNLQPNPFVGETRISFAVGDQVRNVSLKIYDATGKLIKDLPIETSDFRQLTQVLWNGTNDRGQNLPAGIYFVKLSADEQIVIKKLVLLK
jgi:hypothetical protein